MEFNSKLDINPDAPESSKSSVSQVARKTTRKRAYLADGEFEVHGRLKKRVARSLWCLTNRHKIRYASVWLMEWKWFDNIIMGLIIINSICMGAYNYLDENAPKNQILN